MPSSRHRLIIADDATEHLLLTTPLFIRIIILCSLVKTYTRLPTDKLLIKIYVMENIYHYKITAISEETRTETVTNARQGLNVLPFDLKTTINETIRHCSLNSSNSYFLAQTPSFLTLYIPDKWYRIQLLLRRSLLKRRNFTL